jgi:class 3 adenylate cyclase/pimeloyl-ACP methyl ester carboxylesterase
MEPQIQYVRSADGTNIAFNEVGDGVPLIISPNLWCHLTATWPGESREATMRLVREGFRVIRFDMRGMGLSDRTAEDFSLDAQAADIEAICERLRLDRFALHGIVHGTLPSMVYAARRPERVTHLILYVPFADGASWYRGRPTLQGLEAFRAMGGEQWPLYIRTHATALAGLIGTGDPDQMTAIMMQAASPDSLSRYLAALKSHDLTSVLAEIQTPTLAIDIGTALHASFAQAVVAGIDGARLIRVPPGSGSSAFAIPSNDLVSHIVRFVLGRDPSTEDRSEPTDSRAHGTAIILFADIVDSVATTERMGDAAFRERARALDASLRGIISSAGGTAIDGKLLGDGVLATFPAASQAIDAALRCAAAGNDGGFPLHLGIHAGDVIREANNVFGGAVNIASRISALSAPGEVLVSDVVRGLARTSASVAFEDRGEHALKGVGEPQRVYAVRASRSRGAGGG